MQTTVMMIALTGVETAVKLAEFAVKDLVSDLDDGEREVKTRVWSTEIKAYEKPRIDPRDSG